MSNDAPRAPRGIPTLSPQETAAISRAQQIIARRVASFGYDELRLPILESKALFTRAVGASTDIVEKEMYEFQDRNDALLCLRPEGTAGCAAAAMRLGLIAKNARARLWYAGPFFRRERPQKGRYRQFHQVGVEAFGFAGAEMDIELLTLSAMLWKDLDLEGRFELQINTLGDAAARAAHRKDLIAHFEARASELDETARARLRQNPLRILDSKDAATRRVVETAPVLSDYLSAESAARYDYIKEQLARAEVAYTENPRLVRGLDYYTDLVFEWVTPNADGQNTVCAGGRYDGLVALLGGAETPAAGFALGLERVADALLDSAERRPTAYAIALGAAAEQAQARWLGALRRALPEWTIIADCVGGGLKSQLKRADKHGADITLIVGEDEAAQNAITIRAMDDGEQQRVDVAEVARVLRSTRVAQQ